jgi:hypothetical protein
LKGPIKDRSIDLNKASNVLIRSTVDQMFVQALPNPSIDEIEVFKDTHSIPCHPLLCAPITD